MEKKLAFTTQNKDTLIAEQKLLGFALKEIQLHFDGQYLIFTDEPIIDWKAEWALATTATAKLKVLAEMLRLE